MSKTDQVNDEVKLISHRIIARMLKHDPSLLDRAKQTLERLHDKYGEIDFVVAWRDVLYSKSIDEIRNKLSSRDEHWYWLRISSPFNYMAIHPLSDEKFRRRRWKAGKRLVEDRIQRLEGGKLWENQMSDHSPTLTV